jgi:hypothetical protein
MHKHVAATVIWLDEAVAAFPIKKFDRTSHGHRENSSPALLQAALRTSRARCGSTGQTLPEGFGHLSGAGCRGRSAGF